MDHLARVFDGKTQSVKEHIQGVENRATAWALPEFKASASLVAFLHDMGKYEDDWQSYLLESVEGKNPKIIPHAPMGARAIDHLLNISESSPEYRELARDILTYVIRAHHGLFDALSFDGQHSLDPNLSVKQQYLEKTQAYCYFRKDFDWSVIEKQWEQSVSEIEKFIQKICTRKSQFMISPSFALGALVRYLLSLLIDGDWSDAASLTSPEESKWNLLKQDFHFENLHNNLNNYLVGFDTTSDINKMRHLISNEAEGAASRPSGIYRLNVPTGGGKTLSVMRYALSHTQLENKERIIYVAPFKSILDQTAMQYRSSLLSEFDDEKAQLQILEHHGDVVRVESGENNQIAEMLLSNWDAPIIVTTLVQVLNTLLSSNKASIRRMHTLSNSVLIFDEFQAVPIKSLTLLNSWINVLSEFFHTTIILCTATQPPLENVFRDKISNKGIVPLNYAQNPDLVSDYSGYPAFERTKIIDRCTNKGYSPAEAEDLIIGEIDEVQTMLVILNTRSAARIMYLRLAEKLQNVKIQLLNNNMVPAHRKQIIRSLKERLESAKSSSEKLLVISTSLIEAGVDISFQKVIRSIAGLDSIVQAAGRCNRNGELGMGSVLIFNPMSDWENVEKMPELVISQNSLRPILNDFRQNPAKYGGRLTSNIAVDLYFQAYYEAIAGKTHYPIQIGATQTSLYELLDNNEQLFLRYQKKANWRRHLINQSFRTAGDHFEPIESGDISILVPWDKGQQLVINLGSEPDLNELKKILNRAQQYMLNIFRYQFDHLKERGAVFSIMNNSIWILREEFYSIEQGLLMEGRVGDTKIF